MRRPYKSGKLPNMRRVLPTDEMDSTEFEEFCFDLLRELGFVNIDWRKGTGLDSSPSDSGRDIVAQLLHKEVDGRQYHETWFVDCKHYKRGVPPKEISSLLAWAAAERADVALVITSSHLSNPCKDFLKQYETTNRPPYRIRYWERPTLERLLESRDEFLSRYQLEPNARTEAEILEAEQEFFDKVWYVRSVITPDEDVANYREDIRDGMVKARTEVEGKYSRKELRKPIGRGHQKAWEYGYINGKLAALRWVLGDEWDNLDT